MTYSLEQRIKQLEEDLSMEKQVKQSEVQLNATLKEHNEKLKLHIDTLVDINEQYADKIATLRNKLKTYINRE
jgi:chaperonin cofactor prefoldin